MFIKRKELPSPEEFKDRYPVPENLRKIKERRDKEIAAVFTGESDKFIVIIGPCSAHDPKAVVEYTHRLARIQEQVEESLLLIPRVYTNKPRTTGKGYKGMLHQPDPQEGSDIFQGMISIRKMQLEVMKESHLTAGDEMLYPENYPFFDDVLSYHAVGARSVENQQHRLVASGIEAPVGMKNPTSGDLSVMFNGILAAQSSHVFLYRQEEVETTSNPLAHGILRGSVNRQGESIPNYHFEDLLHTYQQYQAADLENPGIIVDTNHANSNKQYKQQIRIAKEVLHSRSFDPRLQGLIKGLMIESFLVEGAQKETGEVYGQSITDPCIGWEDTEYLLYKIAERL